MAPEDVDPRQAIIARFDEAADRYESWYETKNGARAARAERCALDSLIETGPETRSILEVGCGTGYFTQWLEQRHGPAIGLDPAPDMLRELRRRGRRFPVVRGDAHCLPFQSGSFGTVAFITTLEFLDEPERALREAVRVARSAVMLLWLNPHSLGALRRKRIPGHLLSQARRLRASEVRMMLEACGGSRTRGIRWTSALFPWPFASLRMPLPFGDVLAMKLSLDLPAGRVEPGGE